MRGTYLRYSKKSKKVRYLDGCDRACCSDDSADNLSHCSFIAVVLGAVYIAYRSWNINQDAPELIPSYEHSIEISSRFFLSFYFLNTLSFHFSLIFNLYLRFAYSFLPINFSLPFSASLWPEKGKKNHRKRVVFTVSDHTGAYST